MWDIIKGRYEKPQGPSSRVKVWNKANGLALLVIKKNCEPDVKTRIGLHANSKDVYEELATAYEGKTVTEYWALLASINYQQFDDRNTSIEEHIVGYEKSWITFVGMINRVDLTNDDGFGQGLKIFAKSVKAKTEFLLRSIPQFYSNTLEYIRTKEYDSYEQVAKKLREYILQRQKGKISTGKGTQEVPVVLKAEVVADNGKRCKHYISKSWKGLNHTEDECRNKKKDSADAKAS